MENNSKILRVLRALDIPDRSILKLLIDINGTNQSELARRLDLNPRTLNLTLLGYRATKDVQRKLSDYLRVPRDELFNSGRIN